MKKEHSDYLTQQYPKIYRKSNHSFGVYSFECGDGWFNLLKGLSMCIQNYIDNTTRERWRIRKDKRRFAELPPDEQKVSHLNRDMPERVRQVVALQVKEKFGTLRYYYSGGDEVINNYVSYADVMSSLTCEECGVPSETDYNQSWVTTKCATCKGK